MVYTKNGELVSVMHRGSCMDKELEQFMKERLGVSLADVEKMTKAEYDELYDKACKLEEILAVQSEGEPTEELEMAADIVDYLYGPY